jgi:hypothetical protein
MIMAYTALLSDIQCGIQSTHLAQRSVTPSDADDALPLDQAWQFHKRGSTRPGEQAKPRRQDPSRDFVNIWQEIGSRSVYMPQKHDVGRILKLECSPVSANGMYTGKPLTCESSEVLPGPSLAPIRGLVDVPTPPNTFLPSGPKVTFKVLSYNCLADIYATPQVYPYTPAWALAWNFRKRNLLREIVGYKGDILALQEIQASLWSAQKNHVCLNLYW